MFDFVGNFWNKMPPPLRNLSVGMATSAVGCSDHIDVDAGCWLTSISSIPGRSQSILEPIGTWKIVGISHSIFKKLEELLHILPGFMFHLWNIHLHHKHQPFMSVNTTVAWMVGDILKLQMASYWQTPGNIQIFYISIHHIYSSYGFMIRPFMLGKCTSPMDGRGYTGTIYVFIINVDTHLLLRFHTHLFASVRCCKRSR